MNTYVPIFRGLDARGGRKLRTDTHTHTNTRDNYQSYYFGPVREEQVQTIDNNKTTKITDTAGNCLDRHKGTLKIQVIGSDIANTVQRNLTSLRPIGREDSKLIMRLSAIESGDTSGSMSV